MTLFITLLENVNKSRTSANNVSLKPCRITLIRAIDKAEINLCSTKVVRSFPNSSALEKELMDKGQQNEEMQNGKDRKSWHFDWLGGRGVIETDGEEERGLLTQNRLNPLVA
jgi:hypothetical protein